MITAIRAEYRKLLSVRSTYIVTLIAYALLAFASLYIAGYRNGKADVGGLKNFYVASSIGRNGNILSLFGAIIALLLFAHEYRYSTIMYTLTNQKSRTKILAAKILVVAVFTFVYSMIGMGIGIGGTVWGLHLAGGHLPHQTFDFISYAAKLLAYNEGYALGALLFIALIRNQVAAIVTLLIEPGIFEGIMSTLLKHNSVYLPFTALMQVINGPLDIASAQHGQIPTTGFLTPTKGALVFAIYLVVGWLIAWVLFLKRDAN